MTCSPRLPARTHAAGACFGLVLLVSGLLGPTAGYALGAEVTTRQVRVLLEAGEEAAGPLLGALGPRAAPALFELVRDREPRIRGRAVWALGRLGSFDRVMAVVRQRLRDAAPSVRWAACDALGALGDRSAAPALTDVINRRTGFAHLEERARAAEALAGLGASGTVATLLDAIGRERYSEFRRRVAVSLLSVPELGDDDRQALTSVPDTVELATHVAARALLARDGDEDSLRSLVLDLAVGDREVRTVAEAVLVRLGEPAVAELRKDLPRLGFEGRGAAVRVIAAIEGRRARTLLEGALADPAAGEAAARALARLRDTRSIPHLVRALEPAEGFGAIALQTRGDAAVDALAGFGAGAVADVAAASTQPDARTRIWVAMALGRSGAPAAARPLAVLVRDRDSRVRQEAVRGLLEIAGAEELETLRWATGDPDRDVRHAATSALGALAARGVAEAVPALETALADADDEVRSAALRALGEAGGETAEALLIRALREESRRPMRAIAARVLGRSGTRAAERALWGALRDISPTVRAEASQALALRATASSLPRLVAFALADDDPATRALAGEALGRLGLDAAAPELEEALCSADATTRKRALAIVRRTGGERAVGFLERTLASAEGEARAEIERALAAARRVAARAAE